MKHSKTPPAPYRITESLLKYFGDITEDKRKHQFIFIEPYISENEVLRRLNCHDELVEALESVVILNQDGEFEYRFPNLWRRIKQVLTKAEESGK